jgi:hypothetical protein
MKFTVTQAHISNGQRFRTKSCPVALAIKQTLPDVSVVVDATMLSISTSTTYTSYKLSKPLQRFIQTFDSGEPVAPASFIITEYV